MYPQDFKKYNAKFVIVSSIFGFIGICACLGIYFNKPYYVRKLPFSATEVFEADNSFSISPDYWYQLKAKISEQNFANYVRRLELEKYNIDPLMPGFWKYERKLKDEWWWNPSASDENTYYLITETTARSFYLYVKYEKGHLYLIAWDNAK